MLHHLGLVLKQLGMLSSQFDAQQTHVRAASALEQRLPLCNF